MLADVPRATAAAFCGCRQVVLVTILIIRVVDDDGIVTPVETLQWGHLADE